MVARKGEEGERVENQAQTREKREPVAVWCEGEGPPSPSFNSLTKDGLINKSITHTRGAGGDECIPSRQGPRRRRR